MLSSLIRRLTRALLWFAGASVLLVLLFRWVPPPGTMLMVERKAGDETLVIVTNLGPLPITPSVAGQHGPDLINGGNGALRPFQTAVYRVAE